jgi:hypothetical protein
MSLLLPSTPNQWKTGNAVELQASSGNTKRQQIQGAALYLRLEYFPIKFPKKTFIVRDCFVPAFKNTISFYNLMFNV